MAAKAWWATVGCRSKRLPVLVPFLTPWGKTQRNRKHIGKHTCTASWRIQPRQVAKENLSLLCHVHFVEGIRRVRNSLYNRFQFGKRWGYSRIGIILPWPLLPWRVGRGHSFRWKKLLSWALPGSPVGRAIESLCENSLVTSLNTNEFLRVLQPGCCRKRLGKAVQVLTGGQPKQVALHLVPSCLCGAMEPPAFDA